jgi:hypothetical protein
MAEILITFRGEEARLDKIVRTATTLGKLLSLETEVTFTTESTPEIEREKDPYVSENELTEYVDSFGDTPSKYISGRVVNLLKNNVKRYKNYTESNFIEMPDPIEIRETGFHFHRNYIGFIVSEQDNISQLGKKSVLALQSFLLDSAIKIQEGL